MPVFAPCPSCSLRVPLCLAVDTWEPGNRDHPTILHGTLSTLSFAPTSQSSYRNRNVAVAPFRYHCRGSPFHFRHVDKCFLICLSTFLKIA
uniref:Uncharacterized protein n=1 Tax=Triticum urartu TaxID=4572 RepID=A0A8R7VBW3_TRIUA